ncbi:MAG: UDP-N-acetylmuramoyl-L-alanyl-D-glutamate--2,6-diaminopimelate ligase, partial [Pedobacter sp.]|nr:UDP-N-acetylmuramoyl-L-alanyl-D-glutamate--2,6-diaminopimelate ligase [Pedobacter sp.]
MQLQELLYGVKIVQSVGLTDVTINALNFDSRVIGKNDVFVAIRGTLSDGHNFISQVIERGASVI